MKEKQPNPIKKVISAVLVLVVLIAILGPIRLAVLDVQYTAATTPTVSSTAKGNVLMVDALSLLEENPTVLGSSYARVDILTVTFVDYIESTDTSWNVSAAGDNTVMAWVIPNGSGYDLYIGGEGGVVLGSGEDLFQDYTNLREIHFNSCLDTSYAETMTNMFSNCSSLTVLDLSEFDTANVTDMSSMFYNCSSLTELDLSNFDTAAVTEMEYMFYNCNSLTGLDLSNFDTAAVTKMEYMFAGCSSLRRADVSSFDTANVTDLSYLFSGCSSLETVCAQNFTLNKRADTTGMFEGASITAEEAGLNL